VISIVTSSRSYNVVIRRIWFLAAAFALLLVPSEARAHAKLLDSDPKADATLSASPAHITLVFSEMPELSLSSIKLIGPAGDTITLSSLRRDADRSNALTADVPPGVIAGRYSILWTAAGKDGHPSHGSLNFSIAVPTSATRDSALVDKAPPEDFDSGSIAVAGALGSIIARWLSFAACLILIGVMTFRFVVLRQMNPAGNDLFAQIASVNSATFGMAAAAASLLGAMLKLARESSDMPDATLSGMLFGSTWGWSLLLQIIGAVSAGLALYYVHRSNRGWTAALAATALLAVSPSIASHAAASSKAYIAVPADIAHVAVGGMWLGTLAVIVIVGISAALKTPDAIRPGARVATMINVFSPVALTCGGAIVLTGVASALIEVPHLESLWTTPYGVILLLKLFFVALLFVAGAWNWRRMKPRLTGDDAISPMRSSASLELMIAVAVLTVTAMLVALELP
jgi:copper transport protein